MHFNFSSPVILVGPGTLDPSLLNKFIKQKWPIIAADGGANYFYNNNRKPDLIIGDLDSLKHKAHFASRSQIIHIKDQNSTDLQKILQTVSAPLYYCLGFIGSRFDHSLEIMHIMSKYPQQKCVFFSEEDAIAAIESTFQAELPIGTRISLYPLKKTRLISSTGLKYPLNNLVFEQGSIIGTSNENNKAQFTIKAATRGLTLILPKKYYSKLTSLPHDSKHL